MDAEPLCKSKTSRWELIPMTCRSTDAELCYKAEAGCYCDPEAMEGACSVAGVSFVKPTSCGI